MRINEIFTSIQGEGPLSGTRATFIRTSGCNLKCDFCDTQYAEKSYVNIMPSEVIDSVLRQGVLYAVITGGEPMLQHDEVVDISKELILNGIHTTIETNGTIEYGVGLFSLNMVSPKSIPVANSWVDTVNMYDNVNLKFVIDDRNIDSMISWVDTHNISAKKIFFMPKGMYIDEMIQNSILIMKAMNETGLNVTLCPRLQVLYQVR